MNGPSLVIAAHGNHNEPGINERTREMARELERKRLFQGVNVAFHQGEPRFSDVLDEVRTRKVIVVPLMTSEGYYSDVVLPRELGRNPRFAKFDVRITPPVGKHPLIVDIVEKRLAAVFGSYAIPREEAIVAIVGHGTPRHAGSRRATEHLADRLGEREVAADVLTAFLDEEPTIESIRLRAANRHIIVEPFLIADGYHTTHDIPQRLGLETRTVDSPLSIVSGMLMQSSGRWVICDRAIGTDPRIIEVIEARAREAMIVATHRRSLTPIGSP